MRICSLCVLGVRYIVFNTVFFVILTHLTKFTRKARKELEDKNARQEKGGPSDTEDAGLGIR